MRFSRLSRGRAGFTLVELLVVVGIISLLISVVLVGLSGSRAKGRLASAQQIMKGIHAAAMICINTNANSFTLCLPGQNTLGCTATAVGDTRNGGGGFLCANNPAGKYEQLPSGYIYCNGSPSEAQGAAGCGNDLSSLPGGSFRIKAESNDDGYIITCEETSGNGSLCSVTSESPVN